MSYGGQQSLFAPPPPEPDGKPPQPTKPSRPRARSTGPALDLIWFCECGAEIRVQNGRCGPCAQAEAAASDRQAWLEERWLLATLLEQGERVRDQAFWEVVEPEDALAARFWWIECKWDRDEDARTYAFDRRKWARSYGLLYSRMRAGLDVWWPMPPDVPVERWVEDWWFETEEDFWEPEPWLVAVPVVIDVEVNPAYL